jgi:hypothetical protein
MVQNYRKLEVLIPNLFADMAKEAGVQHAVLMSSQGADPTSFFTYMKQKGVSALIFVNVVLPFVDFLWLCCVIDFGYEAAILQLFLALSFSGMVLSHVGPHTNIERIQQAFGS